MSEPASPASIRVTADGPYVVEGVPLVRRRQVTSEHGEPLTWQTVETLDAGDKYALCRCGASGNKPFCDGTHREIGFDGTQTADPTPYHERARDLPATGITVSDDRGLCEHAGFCGNRLTNVWKLVRSDAVDDSIVRAQVMSMVERCPSGALTYRLTEDGNDVEPDLRAEIGIVDDGPLFVSGGVPVQRSDGIPVETRNRMTLCRCGQSSNKPFCDGTHREVGFADRSASSLA